MFKKAEPKPIERFGRLRRVTTPKFAEGKPWKQALFMCDCGSVKMFNYQNVKRGLSSSCGCLRNERARSSNSTHGESHKTVEYRAWSHMWWRCSNKNCPEYPDYGGRGITVCPEWRSYEAFLSDMGRRPLGKTSLDRINNEAGYSKDNCRWADWFEQANNRRKPASRGGMTCHS